MLQPFRRLASERLVEQCLMRHIKPTSHLMFSRGIAVVRSYDPGADNMAVLMKGNIPKPETLNTMKEELELRPSEPLDHFGAREFVDLKIEQYEELYKNDATGETKKTIQLALEEYEFAKYNSLGRVPSNIDLATMQRMLRECQSTIARSSFFNYLFKKEMAQLATIRRQKRVKEARQVIREERFSKFSSDVRSRTGLLDDAGQLVYGLWHNSQFVRLPEQRLKYGSSASRLRDAALFGPTLIFDFDYDEHMNLWYCNNMAEQVLESYGLNRYHYYDPYDMWFCNFRTNDPTAANTIKPLTASKVEHMVTIKPDCFTNYFDKSRLVYLSPNSPHTLKSVGKNDDVYIIGCYNDKGNSKPVSFRKAEQLGIRSAKIPIDQSVYWKGPTKALCINHVTGIMLEALANGNDWTKAILKHVPSRRIKSKDLVIEEQARRQARLAAKMSKSNLKKINLRRDIFD